MVVPTATIWLAIGLENPGGGVAQWQSTISEKKESCRTADQRTQNAPTLAAEGRYFQTLAFLGISKLRKHFGQRQYNYECESIEIKRSVGHCKAPCCITANTSPTFEPFSNELTRVEKWFST
uniref:Uncharacterized protein n=1 Tax=Romanomermis culicivorax TaxID=13658 RepID=A0A915HZU0_ROMCU